MTIQMKATEQLLPCGTVYYVVQGGSNFCVCGYKVKASGLNFPEWCWRFNWVQLRVNGVNAL